MDIESPQVFVFPATDREFTQSVESSLTTVGGRPIGDAGVLAAVEALLRTTYPLATLQRREDISRVDSNAWDAFRDGSALDDELLRRARASSAFALEQLYERHQRLVYAVAVNAIGRSEAAATAVVAAFLAVIGESAEDPPVRIRLAIAARDAARRASGAGPRRSGSPAALRTAVLELAHNHRLTGPEIAVVLRLELPEVRMLATDGLRAISKPETSGMKMPSGSQSIDAGA